MINTFYLKPGDRIIHVDGRTVTVTDNMDEGQWIEAVESDGEAPELVHSQDIVDYAKEQ
ncbi:hypothetical protein SB749_17095 [Brevibacterium sp. SIMBA_078]|uniref:hypothetical protein n=1 Tax=Brevibacterium sp. SIMBA_078 TaxID=3085816 RepID=UPI003978B37E